MKFDLEGSSKLMEHKIKSQIAFFYAASNPSSTAWISAFEEVATEYAGKIIALYVDIDDPKNRPGAAKATPAPAVASDPVGESAPAEAAPIPASSPTAAAAAAT